MSANPRARFHERQQKRLTEAIEVGSSSKKQRISKKGLSSKLVANASSIPIPPSPHAPKAQDEKNIPFHKLGEIITISGDDSTPNAHFSLAAPINVPSREELDVFLQRFPIFTNIEPPISHMNELFPIMKQILVDVTIDPQ
ncbi:hypothetical protein PVL29_014679 [Vitis rotundifolia]|uniref:Uncharacterized protein n=1 Tax=Vitis rotundifolia TaxID=103349 RepID=A0AA38ZJ06_VITRO|nr:hypothetical protein PVL29_014679 [Vitis rotundifolia]